MTQEILVTITLEVDLTLQKDDIIEMLNDKLSDYLINVYQVKEESEIYETDKTIKTQLELQKNVQELAKINIVTCGNCGSVLLHKLDQQEITCPDCNLISEPCDFPDLNY